MNSEDLTNDFRIPPRLPTEPGPECADAVDLAAAVAGLLPGARRERLIHHAADCNHCLSRLAELVRLEHAPPASVPELLRARAGRLVAAERPQRASHRVGLQRWAMAAVVVLAVGLVLGRQWTTPGDVRAPAEQHPDPAVGAMERRSIDRAALRPRILAPAAEATLDVTKADIRWTPVDGSLYYEVRVLSDDGRVLWHERVTDTASVLPAKLMLQPGEEYFVRVDAYLAEAMSVSSPHVVFTVREAVRR